MVTRLVLYLAYFISPEPSPVRRPSPMYPTLPYSVSYVLAHALARNMYHPYRNAVSFDILSNFECLYQSVSDILVCKAVM